MKRKTSTIVNSRHYNNPHEPIEIAKCGQICTTTYKDLAALVNYDTKRQDPEQPTSPPRKAHHQSGTSIVI
jgi:hypothetical protein